MRRSCVTVVIFVVAVLVFRAQCESSEDQQSAALYRGRKTTAALYDLIRGLVFPESPALDLNQQNVDNRFVLLMPGKILNYYDYYPGREYTKFIQVTC